MYEFEVVYIATGETDTLYGYSYRNLAERYPEIPQTSYKILFYTYMD